MPLKGNKGAKWKRFRAHFYKFKVGRKRKASHIKWAEYDGEGGVPPKGGSETRNLCKFPNVQLLLFQPNLESVAKCGKIYFCFCFYFLKKKRKTNLKIIIIFNIYSLKKYKNIILFLIF